MYLRREREREEEEGGCGGVGYLLVIYNSGNCLMQLSRLYQELAIHPLLIPGDRTEIYRQAIDGSIVIPSIRHGRESYEI